MDHVIVYKENVLTPEIFSELSSTAGWPTTELVTAAKAVNGSRYAICAFDGDYCIGMARLIGDGAWSWIVEHVVVRPEYQNKGIGSRMMMYLISFLKSQIPKGQSIGVHLIAANGKVPFYTKFGFETIPNDQNSGQPMKILLHDEDMREEMQR